MYTFIIFFKSRIWNSVGGPPDLKGHAYKVVLSMRGLKVSYPKVNFIVQVQYLWKEKNEIFLIVSFRPVWNQACVSFSNSSISLHLFSLYYLLFF